MTSAINYVLETEPPHYEASALMSPLIRRVLANNPSPFTYKGSGTYIIGNGCVAVIDPGPMLDTHVDAIMAATAGETISHIVITHTHNDHSPAAVPLQARCGAKIVGCAPIVMPDDGAPRSDAAFDLSYGPDHVMTDSELIAGPGWTLEAVSTPGHTSNHMCYALHEEKALFTGDHVMGWSTTVVAPPDGNMVDYIASLRKLLERDDVRYYPTHGKPVEKPKSFVRALIAHRKQRENQILRVLANGSATIAQLVEQMYASTPKVLHGAAGRSVMAHLIEMEGKGQVVADGNAYHLNS